jgi:hypothetical protein
MPRNIEIKAQFSSAGGNAELKAFLENIKALGGNVDLTNPKIKALEGELNNLKKRLHETGNEAKELPEKFGDLQNVLREGVEAPLRSANREGLHLLNSLGKAPAIFATAAFGVGLIATKTYEMVEAQAEAAHELEHMSIKLGLNIQQTDNLSKVSKLAGISVESFQGAARFLALALEDSSGAGKRAADALDKLKVRTHDMSGGQREAGAVLLDTLEALSKIERQSERTFLAGRILPRGAAVELMPLIANYKELNSRLEELGLKTSESGAEQIEALSKTNEKILEMKTAWDELKRGFAEAINPFVVPIIVKITDFFVQKPGPARAALNGTDEFDPRWAGDGALGRMLGNMLPLGMGKTGINSLGPGENVSNSAADSIARGAGLSAGFKKNDSKSVEGMKAELQETQKKISELRSTLSQPLNADAFAMLSKQLRDARGHADRLEASLKKMEERKAFQQKLPEMLAGISPGSESALGKLDKEFKKYIDLGATVEQATKLISEKRIKAIDEFNNKLREHNEKENKKTEEDFKKNMEQSIKAMEETAKQLDEQAKKAQERDKQGDSITKKGFEKGARSAADRVKFQRAAGLTVGPESGDVAAEEKIRLMLAQQIASVEYARIERVRKADVERLQTQEWLLRTLGDTEKADVIAGKIKQANDDAEMERLNTKATMQESIDEARYQREQDIQKIQLEGIQKARSAAGELYQGLLGGPKSLQSMVTNFFKQQGQAVFENVFQGLFQKIGTSLGQIGQKSGLGGLLKGTVLDPKNADTALVTSQGLLKNSIDTLTSTITGQSVGGQSPVGAGTSGIAGALGGGLDTAAGSVPAEGSYDPTGSGLNSDQSASDAISQPSGNSNGGKGILGAIFGGKGGSPLSTLFGSDSSGSQKLMAGLATAGIVAGGVAGVMSGLKQGGGRGVLTATSSVLGTAAALDPEPISKAVLAVAALGTKLIGGLLGDPKANRERAITQEMESLKYTQPESVTLQQDASGKLIDSDFRGRVRVLNAMPSFNSFNQATGFDPLHPNDLTVGQNPFTGQPTGRYIGPGATPPAPIQITVHALDSQSFKDHAHDIASALTKALKDGHRVRGDIMNVVKPV